MIMIIIMITIGAVYMRPFHHVMVHPQVAMEGNVLQIWIAGNILKRQ